MAIKTWAVNADGNWATGSNWSGGTIPGSSDVVTINTATLHTITYSTATATQITSLALGNDVLAITAGTLTVFEGGMTGAGTMTVSAGAAFDLVGDLTSSANTVTFTSAAGQLNLFGGSASDSFGFAVGALKSSDVLNGGTGPGLDLIHFTTAGTIASTVFDNTSHVESIGLANGTNNLTLTDALVSSADDNHVLNVLGGTGNDTVDASAVTTTTNRVFFTAGIGNDNLTGGLGADTFYFAPTALTSSDTVYGGTGAAIDRMVFTGPGTVASTAFQNVTHVEQLVLANGTNNIALSNALVGASDNSHILSVIGGTGSDIVNASAVTTATNSVYITAGTGNDSLTGGAGLDLFYFAAPDLTTSDAVNGGTGAAIDALVFTTAGSIAASAFTNVSHIEQIVLANGTNSVTLPNSLVGTLDDANHALYINGGTGNDTINATALTNTASRVYFITGSGNDNLAGGLGADIFYFKAADLTSADAVNGGTGASIDSIFFTTAGTIAASAFTNVSHIEELALANGSNSLTLTDALVSAADDSHILTVVGGTGNDTISAAAVTTATNRIFFTPGSGTDNIAGGAGADTFYFSISDLTSADTINGGGSTSDRIVFTNSGFISSNNFNGVSHVEQIFLANGPGNELGVLDSMATQSDNGHAVTVFGGTGDDQIDGSGVFSAGNSVKLFGGGGADSLFASAGADVFGYTAVSDSTGGANGTKFDILHAFDPSVDKIDLPSGFTVAGVANVSSGTVNAATFDADMATALGGALTSHEAVTLHVTGGDFNNTVFLVVNPTGAAGYVSGADYVFDISGSSGTYTPATFI